MTRGTMLRTAVAAGALLALGVAVPQVQAAAPKKVFHESLSITTTGGTPVTGPLAAGTAYDFAFLLTNDKGSPQAFGSAKIVPPAGYTLGAMSTSTSPTAAAVFTAAPVGGNVLVTSNGPTGAGIAPGGSLTVTVVVTTPAAGSCSGAWATYVKQSNDFSGTGNDYLTTDATPTTTAGNDSLVITRGATTTQWNSPMSPAPIFSVVDPCGQPASTFTGNIFVTDSLGDLVTGGTVGATAGSATFSNLTFSEYGVTDTLTASSGSFTPVTTGPFDIVQSLVSCAANTKCSSGNIEDNANTTIVTINANSGPNADQIATTVKVPNHSGLFPSCDASGEPPLGAVVAFTVTTRSKTVTMTLPKVYVNQVPNNGTPFMDICLDVPVGHEFVDKSGHLTTTGLLPNCSTTIVTDCVVSRGKNAGNEVISFKLPPGDPHSSWF